MGGVLPFGCIFIQLFFILNSLWSSQMYYMFGFLFLVFWILVITCSETTILLCYFHLCVSILSIHQCSKLVLFEHLCEQCFSGGRLQLVVAIVFDVRLHSPLLIHLLLPLFCYKIVHWRHSVDIFVFWLHIDYGVSILLNDWNHRISRLFLVHPENIFCRESRLKICSVVKVD